MQTYRILTGDVLEELSKLPANYFDASLSDPPYGLSFMGKEWDKGVPSTQVYEQLLRVLKPGAFAMAFGGTRTFHRLACNIEDAGFEMRDCLSWLYGSGFPKSHNISKAIDKKAGAEREVLGIDKVRGNAPSLLGKSDPNSPTYDGTTFGVGTTYITAPATPAAIAWDGYGTALKPAWEPCLLVQKPLAGTFANNALLHGCGGLNIDGCRVGTDDTLARPFNEPKDHYGRALGKFERFGNPVEPTGGRFPANLILDEEAAAALDATQPVSKSNPAPRKRSAAAHEGGWATGAAETPMHNDAGGPSRFFYTAKVSTKERNAGCDALAPVAFETSQPYGSGAEARAEGNEKGSRNPHPTLKPLALTSYLGKLLLPPPREDGQPRRLLVPFSGSGSEMIGALQAGWDEVWGIEIDPAYVEIAHVRIQHWTPAWELPEDQAAA
jgi:site-specific DNA-methyltransferase (adenine-specific)